MRKSGLFLLAIGLILTVLSEFYFFRKEKVVDLRKIEINYDRPHQVNWPLIAGVSVMAVGAAFYVFGRRNSSSMHVVK